MVQMVLAQTVILRVVWRVYGNTLGQMPSLSSSWKHWTGSLNAPRTLTSSQHRSISNRNRLVAPQRLLFFPPITYNKYSHTVHAEWSITLLSQIFPNHTQKLKLIKRRAWDGKALTGLLPSMYNAAGITRKTPTHYWFCDEKHIPCIRYNWE